ncbi:pyruvate kinase [Megasphaera vaginalis (ex Bordigoni et al. 2020)]|uniref:pyruvate kinase n=1 Tax=Megasphaera vaginalis (ex Bordigoni et al. 2020) TaxID=2045301 RepID=UPI000C7C403A|nr:pyruvate kinase [Megasphaera vaginalis (ex Bordigoni et al. 2020)]
MTEDNGRQYYLNHLYDRLYALRHDVLSDGLDLFKTWRPYIYRKTFLYSALNLAFYLALRSRDLQDLQSNLLSLGLSSLGRSEARTIVNLDAVMASLGRICGKSDQELIDYPPQKMFFHGEKLLRHNTSALFGGSQGEPYTHIMVTLPTEAADDYTLIDDLIRSGMNTARINCAHDDKEIWQRMIDNVRRAAAENRRPCKIYMDLSGPKIRIDEILVKGLDTKLFIGDTVFLAAHSIDSYPADYAGDIVITCKIPEIFKTLKIGDPVLIDEGKVQGRISEITPQGAYIRLTYARPTGSKLKNQKSLNFPETPLPISPLTEKDLDDLDFIAAHANLVGYSFVKSAADVRLLQQELQKRRGDDARKIGIIAKVETKESVQHLPEIIVQAASSHPFGVMIARGDLAVEVGYHRLSELQEEILWICEAAHVPVIWATQVLENMVKTGLPSRAEITDAAMGERAECVMLNKGPYIVEAVTSLGDILRRMESHMYKKAPRLKALHIAMNALSSRSFKK